MRFGDVSVGNRQTIVIIRRVHGQMNKQTKPRSDLV